MTRVRVIILPALFLLFFAISLFGPTPLSSKEKPTLTKGKKIYSWYCTPCHGAKGDGKGFNAEYLDPKPANHTNAKEMSKRTDEKLYDTIADGGKSVGKSTFMPPWSGTFREAQIESLVLYLRKLCRCKGPE